MDCAGSRIRKWAGSPQDAPGSTDSAVAIIPTTSDRDGLSVVEQALEGSSPASRPGDDFFDEEGC